MSELSQEDLDFIMSGDRIPVDPVKRREQEWEEWQIRLASRTANRLKRYCKNNPRFCYEQVYHLRGEGLTFKEIGKRVFNQSTKGIGISGGHASSIYSYAMALFSPIPSSEMFDRPYRRPPKQLVLDPEFKAKLMQLLPRKERVVRLRMGGFSLQEIGDQMNISPGRVRQLYHSAIRQCEQLS